MVATSPAFSHRLPHVFARPAAFEPGRFLPPREEDRAAPFSFIGFGGGRHGCMGSNFAILQARARPACRCAAALLMRQKGASYDALVGRRQGACCHALSLPVGEPAHGLGIWLGPVNYRRRCCPAVMLQCGNGLFCGMRPQVKCIWSVLLRDFEFDLVDPFPEPDWQSMVVGPKPCRVRYRRRQLVA